MTLDEVIALVVAKARQHDLVPVEFLGGIIAEGLDPHASRPARQADWRRYWDPPEPRFDVSFGLGQKNARFSDEYKAWCAQRGIPFQLGGPADAYPGDDVIAMIRNAYFDPAHALDVAAVEYRKWRYDPEVEPLHAWSAYNGPVYYRDLPWRSNPNLPNYARGLAEAQRILGAKPMPVTYNLDLPIPVQNHDWDCFEESANWALHACGRNPSDAWLEQQMLVDGIESTANGLEDGSGAQAAAWITRQYADPSEGTPTITAHNVASVSFDDVRSIAGSCPVLIGGHHWGGAGHWVGVRRFEGDHLVLANPGGSGPIYGQQTLDRQQFDARGPFSMVVIQADGVSVPAPPPPPVQPPADPRDARIAELEAQVKSLRRDLDGVRSALGYASVDIPVAVDAISASLRGLKPA